MTRNKDTNPTPVDWSSSSIFKISNISKWEDIIPFPQWLDKSAVYLISHELQNPVLCKTEKIEQKKIEQKNISNKIQKQKCKFSNVLRISQELDSPKKGFKPTNLANLADIQDSNSNKQENCWWLPPSNLGFMIRLLLNVVQSSFGFQEDQLVQGVN